MLSLEVQCCRLQVCNLVFKEQINEMRVEVVLRKIIVRVLFYALFCRDQRINKGGLWSLSNRCRGAFRSEYLFVHISEQYSQMVSRAWGLQTRRLLP